MEKRIIIIDDDASILEAVQIMFELEGFRVLTSMKGSEALTKISTFGPHVILLDVLLSGEDGRDIAKILKSSDDTKNIPLIMFSANPNASDSALSAGADAFVPKPFDIVTLMKTVENVSL